MIQIRPWVINCNRGHYWFDIVEDDYDEKEAIWDQIIALIIEWA